MSPAATAAFAAYAIAVLLLFQVFVARVAPRFHRWLPQKTRLHTGGGMHRVTFIADNGHLGVIRYVVKGIFLLGVPAFGGMALETRACAYGKMETGGLLSLAEGPRHGIA